MELEASLDCMRHCLRVNQETHGQKKNEGKRNMLPKLKKEWINYVIFLTLTLIWSPKKCYLFPSQKAVFCKRIYVIPASEAYLSVHPDAERWDSVLGPEKQIAYIPEIFRGDL